MAAKQSNNQGLHSEINVTPLVDVMLVLLIIFMVTAPMMKQGFEVQLPETQATGIKTNKEPFILSIRKNKRIYIGKKRIKLNHLSKNLFRLFKNRKDKSVYIHADRAVPYGMIAQVMSQIKAAKINHISFVTIPKK